MQDPPWPTFNVLDPDERYFGNSGMVYYSRSRGQWYVIATEWLRWRRERQGVRYPFDEKFVQGSMRDGDPIGFMFHLRSS